MENLRHLGTCLIPKNLRQSVALLAAVSVLSSVGMALSEKKTAPPSTDTASVTPETPPSTPAPAPLASKPDPLEKDPPPETVTMHEMSFPWRHISLQSNMLQMGFDLLQGEKPKNTQDLVNNLLRGEPCEVTVKIVLISPSGKPPSDMVQDLQQVLDHNVSEYQQGRRNTTQMRAIMQSCAGAINDLDPGTEAQFHHVITFPNGTQKTTVSYPSMWSKETPPKPKQEPIPDLI